MPDTPYLSERLQDTIKRVESLEANFSSSQSQMVRHFGECSESNKNSEAALKELKALVSVMQAQMNAMQAQIGRQVYLQWGGFAIFALIMAIGSKVSPEFFVRLMELFK